MLARAGATMAGMETPRETTSVERIFLLGPTATGKSTVGAYVARLLGWRFLDVDTLVEQGAGTRVPEIFAREGEAAFRELEAAALGEAAAERRVVIATGGGIVERAENLALMCERGWLVTVAA